MKTLFFLSGLPRSGSTLLGSILSQHPELQATPTSPLADLLCWIDDGFTKLDIQYTYDKQQIQYNTYNSILENFYNQYPSFNKIVDSDTNRLYWSLQKQDYGKLLELLLTRNQLIEPKIQRAQDIRAKLSLLPIEQQFQRELKGMETKGQIQFKERIVDNYIDGLIQQAKTPAEKTAIENNRIRLKFEYLVQGSDISDLLKISGSTQVLDLAKSQARKELKNMGVSTSDSNYEKLLKELTIKNAAEYSQNLKKNVGSDLFRTEKADGGMMNEPVPQVEQQTQIGISPPTTNNTQMLSYDELRNRLPKEISNDIIKLLSVSYQALGDFAEIATQSDVDKFNLKYGVNLVLPRGE